MRLRRVYHKSEVGGLAMIRTSHILIVMLGILAIAALVGCGPGPSYNKGKDCYNASDYDGAITQFNQALSKDTKNEYPDTKDWIVKSYVARGKKMYDANNLYAAINDYAKARDEGNRLQASQYIIDEADSLYNDACTERDKRKAESLDLANQAQQAMAERRYDDAEKLLAQAVKKDPQNNEANKLLKEVRDIKVKIADSQRLIKDGNAMLDRPNVDLKTAETARNNFERAKTLCDPNPDADAGILRADGIIDTIKKNAQAKFDDGMAKFNEQKWADAVAAFTESARLDYTRQDAADKIAEARKMQSAQNLYEGNLAKARTKLEGDITTVPQIDEVIQLCDDAIAAYPYNDSAQELKKQAETKHEELLAAAEDHYQKGMAAKGLKDYDGASNEFSQCLAINPQHDKAKVELDNMTGLLQQQENLQTLLNEGEALLKAGNPRDAKAKFQEALKLEPGNAQAADGIKRANDMINTQKQEAAAFYNSALTKIQAKNYTGALADLDKALAKDPNNPTYTKKRTEVVNLLAGSFYQNGQAYEKQGKWVLAQKEYEKALKYDKKYQKDVDRMKNEAQAEGLIQHGNMMMEKNDYAQAADDYKNALAITTRKDLARQKLTAALDALKGEADASWAAGDYEGALKQMDDILAIDETYDDLKATVDERRAALDKASADYEKAVADQAAKKLVSAKGLLEGLTAQLPKYQDADKLLDDINADLITAKSAYDRGKKYEAQAQAATDVNVELQKYDLAVAQYEKVLDTAVDYQDAAALADQLKRAREGYDSAEALLAEKKLNEALEAYKAVEAIRKDYADITAKMTKIQEDLDEVALLYNKGVQYQSQKKWSLAIERYKAVLDIIDDYKDVKKRLADCEAALAGGG